MRHHFGDSLARKDGYWTIVPNVERYAYRIGDVPAGSSEATIVTMGKKDEHWSRVFSLPNLQELTLHEPTADQLHAVRALTSLTRLRITHARPKNLDFVSDFERLEELVLEYVSGFDDLTPVGRLPRLRALHVENLRRVSNFGGLRNAKALRYLAIDGTLDWHQPIHDFEFLSDLKQLEVLRLWQVKCPAPYPATLPMRHLKNLKTLAFAWCYLSTDEYALMEECLPDTAGAKWGAYRTVATRRIEISSDDARASLSDEAVRAKHPEVQIHYDGRRWVDDPASFFHEFTGRSAGRIKCSSKTAASRCLDSETHYAAAKSRAREILGGLNQGKR